MNIIISFIVIDISSSQIGKQVDIFFKYFLEECKKIDKCRTFIRKDEDNHNDYLKSKDRLNSSKTMAEKNISVLKKNSSDIKDEYLKKKNTQDICMQEQIHDECLHELKITEDKIKEIIVHINDNKDEVGACIHKIFNVIKFDYFTHKDNFSALDWGLLECTSLKTELLETSFF